LDVQEAHDRSDCVQVSEIRIRQRQDSVSEPSTGSPAKRGQRLQRLWKVWSAGLFGACIALTPGADAGETQRNVLLLFAGESLLPANQAVLGGLQSALKSEEPSHLQIYDEYLDLLRFPGTGQREAVASYLKAKYSATHFDAAVAIGPDALRFLIERNEDIASGAPIVFSAVSENSLKSIQLTPRITGILSQFDLVKTVNLALTLQPDTRHIAVVSGASPFDRYWEQTARIKLRSFESRFPFTYLAAQPLDELLARVGALPANTIIVFLSITEDGTGQRFTSADMAEAVARRANAPTYSVYDTYMGRGIVGGYMDTFDAVGRATGALAIRVLRGEDPGKIRPYEAETHRFIVDWRQIERWGLSASVLPAGTEVRFKVPTAWEQYKTQILIIAAALFLQSLLLLKFYAEVRSRRVAQQFATESAERMDAAVTGADLGLWNWTVKTDGVWATERCRTLLGLNQEGDLTREAFLKCLSSDDRLLALDRIAMAMKTGDICVAEYLIVLPDGTARWILSKAIPRAAHGDAPDHLIGVVLDITERKRSEAEAEQQRQELAHLTRVSIVGALSGALAHELNQPLTAILSNAQAASRMLARKSADMSEIQQILVDIVEDDKRAGDVIHHLRSLLRKGESTSVRLDANALAASVLALCHSDLVLKNVTAMKRLGSGLPEILGDPIQLRQVLLNLIVNACDAMASKPGKDRLLVVMTELANRGGVRFSVSDSGDGLSTSTIEDLFQPFYTTKSLGLGLGLPICQWIISAHGGQLSAENNPTGGATFFFELPSAVEAGRDEPIASRVSRG
jgi:C4-dicarboxylate-specific signal transduction histidine kinase/ABC-type uncharacterized transport system substrate-binding protein